MINSGDKLPDIICTGNISVSDAYNYGQAGALLDVSDYYKNGLAVNADKAVAQHPDWNLITNITCFDGSIYGVPRIQVSPSNETKYKLWINQTWLDKLDMELPTTTEEFKEMLIRFRDEDPNGNGEKDEPAAARKLSFPSPLTARTALAACSIPLWASSEAPALRPVCSTPAAIR